MKATPLVIAFILCSGGMGCNSTDQTKAGKDTGATSGQAAADPNHGLTEAQANEVLAKVGDRVITVGEFADRLAAQSPYLRARFENPEKRKEFLADLIRFELLVHEAKRRGYGDKPEVVRARRHSVVQQLVKKEVDDKIQVASITDADIKKAYDDNPNEYNRAAQMRASHILIKDVTKAKQTLARAKEMKNVDAFRKFARQTTEDDATKTTGGDLQFFAAKDGDGPDRAIRKAAFTLTKVGDVFPRLVKTDAGSHIVMLTGKRAALTRSFDQAKRAIRHKLMRERKETAMNSLLEQLRAEIPVEIDKDALSDIRIDPAPLPTGTP